MNTEDYVNFKQAQLLKEKDFHYDCRTCYIYDDTFQYVSDITEMFCGDYAPWMDFNAEPKTDSCEYISAPTQASVQKWFRKEKNITLLIKSNSVKEESSNCVNIKEVFSFHITNRIITDSSDNIYYDSYEQALSAGIDKTLTLI